MACGMRPAGVVSRPASKGHSRTAYRTGEIILLTARVTREQQCGGRLQRAQVTPAGGSLRGCCNSPQKAQEVLAMALELPISAATHPPCERCCRRRLLQATTTMLIALGIEGSANKIGVGIVREDGEILSNPRHT